MTNKEITNAIEEFAPLSLQESWDNSGWQVGNPDAECSGVLLCVDITAEVLDEARRKGCNLIVSHHPLFFKGVKQILGRNRVERCAAQAISYGISVYSSHTATDCAPHGVSWEMARMLGVTDIQALDESGLGAIGNLPQAMPWRELVDKVKATFGAACVKCSHVKDDSLMVSRLGMCGGSAGDFLPLAHQLGAQAYITADCRLNQFLDYADDILLIDSGHFETEQCTKQIFYRVISEKFPNFAVWKSTVERNPIAYL
jgi:dinuclear metal center YbgI/SA1388 family protein